jgi:SAM-dependent methyltransferase
MPSLMESYLSLEQTDLLGVVLEAQTRSSGQLELPIVEGLLTSPRIRSVLDVGTGEGSFLRELARRLPQTRFLGIDHNERSLAKAARRIRRPPLQNVRLEAAFFDAGYDARKHDAILTRYTLQHCSRPRAFLAAALARLKRKGRFVAIESVEDYTDSHGGDAVWSRYRQALSAIHTRIGSNGNIGKALGSLFTEAGLERVHVRLVLCSPSTVGYARFRTVVLSTAALGHRLFPDLLDRRLLRSLQSWSEDRARLERIDPYHCTAIADGRKPCLRELPGFFAPS